MLSGRCNFFGLNSKVCQCLLEITAMKLLGEIDYVARFAATETLKTAVSKNIEAGLAIRMERAQTDMPGSGTLQFYT